MFLSLELLYKSCFILISPAGGIFKLDFPTFVYKNAYAAIVTNDVHFELAKVPKKSKKTILCPDLLNLLLMLIKLLPIRQYLPMP